MAKDRVEEIANCLVGAISSGFKRKEINALATLASIVLDSEIEDECDKAMESFNFYYEYLVRKHDE